MSSDTRQPGGRIKARRRTWSVRVSRRGPLVLTAALMLGGCLTVGPNYTKPRPETSKAWHAALQGGLTAHRPDPAKLAHWWTLLGDAELTKLEARAVAANLDIRQALARVREARAALGIEKAAAYPGLDASGRAIKERGSENAGIPGEDRLYDVGFDAGWELDIFGGVRRSIEAATAELEAMHEDLRDVLVSLEAEVARNYVEVRTYEARLAAMRANLDAQQESYDFNLSRFKSGLIDELAVQQSLQELETTRAEIPILKAGLAAAENRLAVLLAQTPGSLDRELEAVRPIPVPPLTVAVGIPADTLRRRPDVRRAERILAAQTARIGVATAQLYPTFRLSGSIGLESLSTGNLWQWASRTYQIGPSFSWPIFHAGAIRRNIEVATARQAQALIGYQKAVLAAQEDVEDALVAYAKEQRRSDALGQAELAARRALSLAKDQYRSGLVDFTTVLGAQQALQSLQDGLAESRGEVTLDLIRLYKALGGGWMPMSVHTRPTTKRHPDNRAPTKVMAQ